MLSENRKSPLDFLQHLRVMPLLGFPSVSRHLHASPEERRTVKIKMVNLESCIFGLKYGGLGLGIRCVDGCVMFWLMNSG